MFELENFKVSVFNIGNFVFYILNVFSGSLALGY